MLIAAIVALNLVPGMRLERDLSPTDEHIYTAQLDAGGALLGEADQNGVDLVVEVIAPDGKKLATIDSPNGMFGPEPIDVTAIQRGTYKLVIHTLDKDAKPGKYVMKIDSILTPAVNADRLAQKRYASPALYELWRSSQSDRRAVDDFVAARKGKGPIVEPIDAKSSRVTYLYLGDANTDAVRENGGPHGAAGGMLMTRFMKTPLFFASETVPNDARYTYGFAAVETRNAGALQVTEDVFKSDALNPRAFAGFSVMELPGAPPQEYIDLQHDVPQGKLTDESIESSALKQKRSFSVYTPANDDAMKDHDLLIVFDGPTYGAGANPLVPTPTILDNLIARKKIGPVVALLVANINRNRDLGINPEFADFLANELVPWARKNYRIAEGPQHVITAGSSRGGFAATYAAFKHPEAIGNVLSQSGSFWITPDEGPPKFPFSESTGYLVEQFRSSPRLPIRFYIEIGRFDNGIAMLPPNRELRDILFAKGYDVTYREFDSGHDYLWWRGSLADGLIALLGR